jgi:cell division protein FtsI/penicillin-binding protein 2
MVHAMLGVVIIGLIVQLVRVQFGPYAPVFQSMTKNNAGLLERLEPPRGTIYDREGKLLATNASQFFLEFETLQLTDQSRVDVATVIGELLNLSIEDLENQLAYDDPENPRRIRLTYPTDSGTILPIIVDATSAGIIGSFLDDPFGPDLSGLDLVNTQIRVYPTGSLTGHLLGIVSQEGKGYFGVEGFYDDWLSGNPVIVKKQYIPLEASLQPNPPAGVNLVLTIDLNIQQTADLALMRAIRNSGAESGQVIIMNPQNGEILAMTAWPRFDPHKYEGWLVSDGEENPIVTPGVAGQFEPGSTFKVLVMAAALNEGVVSPFDEFIDTGEIEVGGHIIRNWDGEAWGPQNMITCMQYSLNVCLAWVGAYALKAAHFYEAMQAFGIGSKTGVDLAGEGEGVVRYPGEPDWSESDLGTNSFGQGLSVTPIQLMTAFAAVANGGEMVQPHVVLQVAGPKGNYWPQPNILGRPISKQTAEDLTMMLTLSLEEETGVNLVPGYKLAGKTGTAQIPTEFGYDPNFTIASFIGWGPVDDPQFLVFISLDRPTVSPWGSEVATPVFKEIVERLVIHLEIQPIYESGAFVAIEPGN